METRSKTTFTPPTDDYSYTENIYFTERRCRAHETILGG